MTLGILSIVLVAAAVIFWQETLLRKREATIEALREEIDRLHELRVLSIPSPPVRFPMPRTPDEPHKP